MRLVGFSQHGGERHIGRRSGAQIEDLGSAMEFFANPVLRAVATAARVLSLEDVTLAPAVPSTARVFCVGINYFSHADESKSLAGLDVPEVPMVFGRWESTLITDGETTSVPDGEQGLDWEVELAVVIGSPYRHGKADPAAHVFAYAAFNDLSARRKQMESSQFTLGKNADRSGPISDLVTIEEVGDISGGLRVTTHVNGVLKQEGNTRDLIHDIPAIIRCIAQTTTLLPGDVIATGTPGGVGAGMNPPEFLNAGDEVVVEVERVGRVRTTVI